MNSKLLIKDPDSEILSEELALELKLEPNSIHEKPLGLTWEFLGWTDSKEMKFKVIFDNPLAVSSDAEKDFLQVKFYDQSLFLAQDEAYVELGKTIRKKVPQQLEDNSATAAVGAAAEAVSASLAGVGITSLVTSIFISAALNFLWGLLNAL